MIKAKLKIKFDKNFSKRIIDAIQESIEYWALAFEREAKEITTLEKHVRTWRYRASINLNERDWIPRERVAATQNWDWIHEISKKWNEIVLSTWSNVEYAIYLERRYQILARALDRSMSQIRELFIKKLKKKLWLS